MDNIIKTWNDKLIRFRESDGYGCLTDMAKATGKKVNDWMRLDKTKEYLEALSNVTGNPVGLLLETINEGNQENKGTWGERKVCIRFAQWCSPDFAVQVDIWIEEFLTQSVKPMSPAEIIIAQGQAMLALEKRQAEMEAELAMIRHIVEANELETQANTAELERFRNGHGFYFSIAGFCSLKGIKPSLEWMKQQGRKASAICKIKGINPVPVTDPRWGQVNTYPDTVLIEMDWSSFQ